MTDNGAPILETADLVAGYGEVNILHRVSITVPPNAFVSVIGPNGAGKSTLLKAIYGLLTPRGGSVTFRRNGSMHDITGKPPHRLTDLGLNYVPQVDNVFPNLTIGENLEKRRRACASSTRLLSRASLSSTLASSSCPSTRSEMNSRESDVRSLSQAVQ